MDGFYPGFNFPTFSLSLNRICLIGISASHVKDPEFEDLKNNLIKELEKYSRESAIVFRTVLSENFLTKVSIEMLRPLNDGFMHYSINFAKSQQLHRQTITNNMRLAKANFVELIKLMKSAQEAKLIACISLYLERITQQYLLSGQNNKYSEV